MIWEIAHLRKPNLGSFEYPRIIGISSNKAGALAKTNRIETTETIIICDLKAMVPG